MMVILMGKGPGKFLRDDLLGGWGGGGGGFGCGVSEDDGHVDGEGFREVFE